MEIPRGRRVESAMVRRPVTHAADLTVREARSALLDPHRHLLLLVRDDVLVGTVAREDLVHDDDDEALALDVSRLSGRTTLAGANLRRTVAHMQVTSARRLAVVDRRGTLLGLLCRKASGTGFCTDAGIAARAREQLRSPA